MPRSPEQFQTIHTEGAILPPDVLQRIATGELEGLEPATYHLPTGTKTKEAISQSWTRLLRYWKDFQAARKLILESDETGTLATREKWLLPLFQELGYGRLTTSKAPEIDGKLFPIERFWQRIPIHLIGCKLQLDHRTKGARGAATAIPHSMVQEFLNRSAEHAWAFLSNGLQLRVLRDSAALSRQSFVEFDLESMMEGEVYADFAILWLVCHQSRLEGDKPEDLWLEKWSKLAQEQGTRILEDLRGGVAKAIESLGRGFISHPRNETLINRLQSGSLTTQDYYRQILRIVYRLLFLFVAEDRGLLHPPTPSNESLRLAYDAARERYDRFYSLRRLRDLAESYRGSKHADLWHSLSLLFDALGRPEGCPQLALPAFGSFLWSHAAAPDLSGPARLGGSSVDVPVLIRNEDLLEAIRALAFVERNRVLRAVNYRNLGSVELGSVYESLLELHPQINIPGRGFALNIAAGNERKTTGSFYTPDPLVQYLLDSALEPVVANTIKGKTGVDAEKAILDLKVCDPAVGSGHFLIAAAHRLARHLARARTGESEPSPQDYQHALRDVIGHCLYGVDLNPMAVELCKISLWMEALEPGRPLGFLDHRIVVGNSLLGTTPALLHRGIPDTAFEAIEGDDKAYCRAFKKQNKDERSKMPQLLLYRDGKPWEQLGNLAASVAQLDALPDDSVSDIRTKERRYADLVKSSTYESGRLLADTWCAAFGWKKTKEFDYPITEKVFRDIEHNPHSIPPWMKTEILRLCEQYQFFHWHLAFPDVFCQLSNVGLAETNESGWSGGFDVMLGNPPWEKINLKDEEFFAQSHPQIANAANKSQRKRLIQQLKDEDPAAFATYEVASEQHDRTSGFFRFSGYYPLTGVSRINLYSVFCENGIRLLAQRGRLGMVLASGIITDDNNKALFAELIEKKRLVHGWDFENREGIFPDVHSSYKFCLFCGGGTHIGQRDADFAFYLTNVDQLSDPMRHFTLSSAELQLLNPVSRMCPTFRGKRDAEISKKIYRSVPAWSLHAKLEGWPGVPKTPFNMSNDSGLFVEIQNLESSKAKGRKFLPLYEAKFVHQFNHRYASFEGTESEGVAETTSDALANPSFVVSSRYLLDETILDERFPGEWFFVWRDITCATNERTSIAAIVPKYPCAHTLSLVEGLTAINALMLAACTNSFVYDFCARQKVAGTHLNHGIWKQLPVLPPSVTDQSCPWRDSEQTNATYQRSIATRVLELSFTANDLRQFAKDCGYDGPPFVWDEERRFQIRCELDAAYFHLYGIARDDVDYIMETFPIVKRKDIDKHGSYRTKEKILEIYDQIAESQVIQSERVWHVIFVLVGAWKKKGLAVGRPALETGLLLMFKDELRKKLLGVPSSQPSSQGSSRQASPLHGLDYFIAEGDKQHWLKVTQSEYQQTIEAGASFPNLSIALDDITRVAETMTVINRIAQKEVELPSTGVHRVELSNKPVSTTSTVGA